MQNQTSKTGIVTDAVETQYGKLPKKRIKSASK